MSHIRAVLWDMDGTLIDSEEFHWISWRDTLTAESITITHATISFLFRPTQRFHYSSMVGYCCYS